MIIINNKPFELEGAIDALSDKEGLLVGLPTETVYGLAADACSDRAVKAIFDVKGRPLGHPLIVHVGYPDIPHRFARISMIAEKLIQTFWPGPLTLVLPLLNDDVLSSFSVSGLPTVAVRMPNHPIALDLLRAFAHKSSGLLVAPSANPFGRLSPVSAQHVYDYFVGDKRIYGVIDGGRCAVGIESTIVDCVSSEPKILRPGMITSEDLSKVLGMSVTYQRNSSIKVSGSLEHHYTPSVPLYYLSIDEMIKCIAEESHLYKVLALFHTPEVQCLSSHVEYMPSCPDAYAQCLFERMHRAEQEGFDRIYIEQVPRQDRWRGIQDRLMRSSAFFDPVV